MPCPVVFARCDAAIHARGIARVWSAGGRAVTGLTGAKQALAELGAGVQIAALRSGVRVQSGDCADV